MHNLGDLAGKRVKAALAAQAAELEAAYLKADSPDATPEDIERAKVLAAGYQAAMASYDAAAAKKAKTIFSKLKTAQERNIKIMGKIDPVAKQHALRINRVAKIKVLQDQAMKIQGQPPSPERDASLQNIAAVLQMEIKKEKKFIKDRKIVAVIASVVIGIFTFGSGSAVVSGAYEAIKKGAVELAKKLLMGAIAKAAISGANKTDVAKAREAADAIGQYPPDPNLPSLDAMVQDSLTKKQIAQEQASQIAIPAAIAAFTLLS